MTIKETISSICMLSQEIYLIMEQINTNMQIKKNLIFKTFKNVQELLIFLIIIKKLIKLKFFNCQKISFFKIINF